MYVEQQKLVPHHMIFSIILSLPLKAKHSHQHPAFKQLSGGRQTGSLMYIEVPWSSRIFCARGGPKYHRIQTEKGKLCGTGNTQSSPTGKVKLLKAEIPHLTV